MSKQDSKKTKKKRKSSENFRKVLASKKTTYILLTIIAIPVLLFGFNLLRAELAKSKPVIGSRFEHGLDPEITKEDLKKINEIVQNDNYVESEVILKVSTLRVYIEVPIETSKDRIKEIAQDTYDEIIKEYPVKEYFSIINNQQKQYDFEIHVYTSLAEEDDKDFKYYQMNKSSSMKKPKGQMMSQPKDKDFAKSVKEYAEERRKEEGKNADE